ncbi:MAG: hypothetical protein A2511_01130 [Deltaproteobacteria bacterium RIFOXYD12_FULL_50_9]|nr:MAG: hypothetical protein A2511_01130 [Deltaproteobacteria bacterium RIFOXYD12_FULL_50_9]
MNIKLPFSRQDMAMYKLPVLLLAVSMLVGVVFSAGGHYFRKSQAQALLVAQGARAGSEITLKQAEDEKKTIEEYIERYRRIKAAGLMEEESRLDLVEAIGRTRERYKLFPVQLEIDQQNAVVPGPAGLESSETGFSLQESPLRITMPLLQEEDLSHLLEDLYKNKGLFVVESCSVTRGGGTSRLSNLGLEATLSAACRMHWITIRQSGN